MKHVTTRLRRLFAPIGLHWYLALLLTLDALMVLRPVVVDPVALENEKEEGTSDGS